MPISNRLTFSRFNAGSLDRCVVSGPDSRPVSQRHGKHHWNRWLMWVGLSILATITPVNPVMADPCTGTLNGEIGAVARARTLAPFNNPLGTVASACTAGVPFGPNVVLCSRTSNVAVRALYAWFVNSAANATGSGCDFNCGPITCRVEGVTGLPVELMTFEVE